MSGLCGRSERRLYVSVLVRKLERLIQHPTLVSFRLSPASFGPAEQAIIRVDAFLFSQVSLIDAYKQHADNASAPC